MSLDAKGAAMLAPAGQTDRISSLDVLRGFALLGIALMNIVFSGLPQAADWNPRIAGGATGPNLAAYFIEFVFLHGKMRGLFSMMFGASAYLLVTRLAAGGAGLVAAQIYTRRILWLMVFGLAHAFLIWHGDILYAYSLLGLLLLPLLAPRPKTLLIAAGAMLLVMTGFNVRDGFQAIRTHDLAVRAETEQAAGPALTGEQTQAKQTWEHRRKYIDPSGKDLKEEREMYSGSYFHLAAKRAALFTERNSLPLYMYGWDMLTMMVAGIGFMKSRVVSGERSAMFYRKLLLCCYLIGVPLGSYSAYRAWAGGFGPVRPAPTFSTYQTARVAMTIRAYVGGAAVV